jgi:16S rRNA (guanine527-N7)-methyltransferase
MVIVNEMIPPFVTEALEQLGLSLPKPALAQMSRYLDLLLAANERVNLTAIRDRDQAWKRMIIDSLTILPGLDELEPASRVIDIGTGGGLPGIPVTIARPQLDLTLLESTGKKVGVLDEFIETLGLPNCRAVQQRAEVFGQDAKHRAHYDAAVSRAIGNMSAVLEYSLPLVKEGGRVLAMKGPKVEQELDAATDALDVLGAGDLQVVDAYTENFDNELVIVSIIKERPTPEKYPRNASRMKQKPL